MCVVMWHDCTWHGWGYVPSAPPPPNFVMHVCACFSVYVGLTRRYFKKYGMWVNICVVMCHDRLYHWWGYVLPHPPPPDWVLTFACTFWPAWDWHREASYCIKKNNFNFKFWSMNLKLNLARVSKNKVLWLIFVNTTSDVYLTSLAYIWNFQ
jgi:hypothetical protein